MQLPRSRRTPKLWKPWWSIPATKSRASKKFSVRPKTEGSRDVSTPRTSTTLVGLRASCAIHRRACDDATPPIYRSTQSRDPGAFLGMPAPPATKIVQLVRERRFHPLGPIRRGIFFTRRATAPASITLYLPPKIRASRMLQKTSGQHEAHTAHDAVETVTDADGSHAFSREEHSPRRKHWPHRSSGWLLEANLDSIREKLLVLPDRTLVLPATVPLPRLAKRRIKPIPAADVFSATTRALLASRSARISSITLWINSWPCAIRRSTTCTSSSAPADRGAEWQ